jgi:hypothetical protein
MEAAAAYSPARQDTTSAMPEGPANLVRRIACLASQTLEALTWM